MVKNNKKFLKKKRQEKEKQHCQCKRERKLSPKNEKHACEFIKWDTELYSFCKEVW